MSLKKYQVEFNGKIITFDSDMFWEYPQDDTEESGANQNNDLIREVLPERMKLGGTCLYADESTMRTLLKARAKHSGKLNFYDIRTGTRREISAYPVSDEAKASYIDDNGDFIFERFELRFVQMKSTAVNF